MMFCQHCTVTPSKTQPTTPEKKHHKNSAHSAIRVLQHTKYHFLLEELGANFKCRSPRILLYNSNWFYTLRKAAVWPRSERPSSPAPCRKQGQLPGCAGSCPTGAGVSPRWGLHSHFTGWATLAGKIMFKQTPNISICARCLSCFSLSWRLRNLY